MPPAPSRDALVRAEAEVAREARAGARYAEEHRLAQLEIGAMSPAEWKFHCAADMTAPGPMDGRDDDIGYFGEGLVEFDEEYGGDEDGGF